MKHPGPGKCLDSSEQASQTVWALVRRCGSASMAGHGGSGAPARGTEAGWDLSLSFHSEQRA